MNLQKRNRRRLINQGDTNADGKMSYQELRAECKRRGLPANGKREDLEARLKEDLEARLK